MQFDENKHPRDEKGQFAKGKTVGGGVFKKTGETTILGPEDKTGDYRGRDNYPQNISHYELIKEAREEYNKHKVVNIELDSEIQKRFDNATPKERTKIAYKYIKDKLRGKYATQNSVEVNIYESTANKISHTMYEPKIRVTPQLAELINSGEYIDTKKAEHNKFNRFIYYNVNMNIGNKKFKAVLNVGVDKNNDCVLYDINQFVEK